MTDHHTADALDDLADFIERIVDGKPPEDLFLSNDRRIDRHVLSMDTWLENRSDDDSCKTAGCIAGTKWLLDSSCREDLRHSRYGGHSSPLAYATKTLRLDNDEAAALFRHKDPPSVDLNAITVVKMVDFSHIPIISHS